MTSGHNELVSQDSKAPSAERILFWLERYFKLSEIFQETFELHVQRGIFWALLFPLLEQPDKALTFKELKKRLKGLASDSKYLISETLMERSQMGYVSCAHPGGQAAILKDTRVKLEQSTFDALKRYGAAFRDAFGSDCKLPLNDLKLYVEANKFLKNKYLPEWQNTLNAIGLLAERKGALRSEIDATLGTDLNYWALINIQLVLKLRSRLQPEGFSPDEIAFRIHHYTYVTQKSINDRLKYLADDVGILSTRTRGAITCYSMIPELESELNEFVKTTGPMFDDMLAKLTLSPDSNDTNRMQGEGDGKAAALTVLIR